MVKKLFFLVGLGALLGTPVLLSADEVWESDFGRVIYARDVGPTATWTYVYNGRPGVMHIVGLAGVYSNRGGFDGYWAQRASGTRCAAVRPGPGGKMTHYWGRLHIQFVNDRAWNGLWGACEATPTQRWNGRPAVR